MKILSIDIETAPNVAHTWGLWNQTIGLNQLQQAKRVMCFAASWVGSDEVEFQAEWFRGGRPHMLLRAHRLIDEADAVLYYNGDRFDLPHLNTEWLLAKLGPPSPVQRIDLLKVMRRQFKFESNKLDYVAGQLGVGRKLQTGGHELWTGCMNGDKKARRRMRLYNCGDVVLNKDVYKVVQPWIPNHPHVGLYTGDADCCPRCGSMKLQRRGEARNRTAAYPRFQCQDCGGWSQGTKSVARVNTGGTQ